MIKALLFDIDGTLIRTGGAGMAAFEQTFATEFGCPSLTARMTFSGRTDSSLVREGFLLGAIPPTPSNFSRFYGAYVVLLEQFLHSRPGAACPGVVELLALVQKMEAPPAVGLLTGNIRNGAKLKLGRYGLWDAFAFGAFGDDHEDRNVLAGVALQRASEFLETQVRGDEVLVIGDTPRDVECARAIGAKVLAVATGGATLDQLDQCCPDWLASDLTQILIHDLMAVRTSGAA